MPGAAVEPGGIGLLFSRGGATGLSDRDHFFGGALATEEVNCAGGVLGRPIDVIAYDPASDAAAYRDFAERLLTVDGVSVLFGCHTSNTRKAVLRTIERRNGLLWHPSIYEGFEYSPNVLRAGPAQNQTVFPLSDYLVSEFGLRCAFIGADYIFPCQNNRVMRDLVEERGSEVLSETYLPMVCGEAALREAVEGRLDPRAARRAALHARPRPASGRP